MDPDVLSSLHSLCEITFPKNLPVCRQGSRSLHDEILSLSLKLVIKCVRGMKEKQLESVK